VVIPPNTPHAFANAGATVLEMMDIHASEQQIVTILLQS
jgi:mannose-6-phosphate isomerase-like protein (cupin superfamily)